MKKLLLVFGLLGSVFSASAQGDSTEVFVYGCTDSLALNYNVEATLDDGSCIYDWGDSTKIIYGCTDSLAINFDPWANSDDGSCEYGMGLNEEDERQQVSVYPIPFTSALNVKFAVGLTENVAISIYTASGSCVYRKTLSSFSSQLEVIDATHLRNGVYLLEVSGSNFHLSQKLIKN